MVPIAVSSNCGHVCSTSFTKASFSHTSYINHHSIILSHLYLYQLTLLYTLEVRFPYRMEIKIRGYLGLNKFGRNLYQDIAYNMSRESVVCWLISCLLMFAVTVQV